MVTPHGGESMFKGQAFVVDLSASFDSVVARESAVLLNLGAKSKGSRAYDLQAFTYQLEDAAKKLAKAKETKNKDKVNSKKGRKKG